MTMLEPVRTKILVTLILVCGFLTSFSQCKNIDADAKATAGLNGNSIVVDIKNSRTDLFKISVFGPNKQNILNSEKSEFNNLSSGKYLVVIVGRREEDNYCPKSINVTIN